MLKSRQIDKICLAAAAAAAVFAFVLAARPGLFRAETARAPAYAAALFDAGRVSQIDIEIENWEKFLEEAREEKYVPCAVTINGERAEGAGIRAKGNNSLRLTEKYGHIRYSLKIEFDRFVPGGNWRGLDKMSLDAAFQDNSYLKNFTAYRLMERLGVPAPLRAFAWVTVNGRPHGLFLAVEEPEEAFARRSFGPNHGMLYKPDYRSLEDENADVALIYSGGDPLSYPGIFSGAKFPVSRSSKLRLIDALKRLGSPETFASAADPDTAARYFAAQVFVVNMDGYLGPTGHNYFLYEKNGRLMMLPWDYNLAFGTYSLGAPERENDAGFFVNLPVCTPAAPEILAKRPFFTSFLADEERRALYRARLDEAAALFESGEMTAEIAAAARMIAPYVQRDPTAFCSYEDHALAVGTLTAFCELRAKSIRAQLEGRIPPSAEGRAAAPGALIDASSIRIEDMGEIADLTD